MNKQIIILQNIFESITCHCAEGVEFMTRTESAKIINKEAMQGWSLCQEYKKENDELGSDKDDCRMFVRHIEEHLNPRESVICKICDKTLHEIVREEKIKQLINGDPP